MSQAAYQKQAFKYLSEWDPSEKRGIFPNKQVVTCFFQQSDKYLVLQRARKDQQHGLWGIPGGKLDKGEEPLAGLVREACEELEIKFLSDIFQLLGTALSHTPSDGEYGLYVYHAFVPTNLNIKINSAEHYAYRWATIDEFQKLDLLTAQREAFYLVQDKLLLLKSGTTK